MSTIKQAYEDKNYFDKAHYEAMRQSDKMKILPSDSVAGVKRLRPHIHAELIHAWADGAQIECQSADGRWVTLPTLAWDSLSKYRVKPDPDVVLYYCEPYLRNSGHGSKYDDDNLKIIFDGMTGKIKSAEVI